MSEHFFGLGRGKLTDERAEAIDEIATEHGATFQNPTMPEGPRYWFACPNRGEPFDSRRSREVLEAVRAAGHMRDDGSLITASDEEDEG